MKRTKQSGRWSEKIARNQWWSFFIYSILGGQCSAALWMNRSELCIKPNNKRSNKICVYVYSTTTNNKAYFLQGNLQGVHCNCIHTTLYSSSEDAHGSCGWWRTKSSSSTWLITSVRLTNQCTAKWTPWPSTELTGHKTKASSDSCASSSSSSLFSKCIFIYAWSSPLDYILMRSRLNAP